MATDAQKKKDAKVKKAAEAAAAEKAAKVKKAAADKEARLKKKAAADAKKIKVVNTVGLRMIVVGGKNLAILPGENAFMPDVWKAIKASKGGKELVDAKVLGEKKEKK